MGRRAVHFSNAEGTLGYRRGGGLDYRRGERDPVVRHRPHNRPCPSTTQKSPPTHRDSDRCVPPCAVRKRNQSGDKSRVPWLMTAGMVNWRESSRRPTSSLGAQILRHSLDNRISEARSTWVSDTVSNCRRFASRVDSPINLAM